MSSFFERLPAFTLVSVIVLAISVHGSHVRIKVGFCFVDFVALVASEGGTCPDVVVKVKLKYFSGSNELSTRALDSRKAIVLSAGVSRQVIHFRKNYVAYSAFESKIDKLLTILLKTF